MTTPVRRALLVVPPLAVAGVLLIHPTDQEATIYESVRDQIGPWLTVHLVLLVGFPLLALATYVLLDGLVGRAATVARVSLLFFLAFYTAYEAIVGLATGIAAEYANGLDGAARGGAAAVIEELNRHWIVNTAVMIGSIAWIVAMVATAVAVQRVGVRWPALALLGVSAIFVLHPPPFGPVALVAFAAAATLIERTRTRTAAERTAADRTAPVPA
jgi:hypothetical protein